MDPFAKALITVIETWILGIWQDYDVEPDDPEYETFEVFRRKAMIKIHQWEDGEFARALPEWISEAVGAQMEYEVRKGLMP